eukprot:scaffold15922_cov104-Skeletonema_dohrnii-CCMP3373.AAC.5
MTVVAVMIMFCYVTMTKIQEIHFINLSLTRDSSREMLAPRPVRARQKKLAAADYGISHLNQVQHLVQSKLLESLPSTTNSKLDPDANPNAETKITLQSHPQQIFFGCLPLWTLGCIYSSLVCTKSSSKNLFADFSLLEYLPKQFD